ncbi:MAG: diguanylate cyclase [Solirubrobacterales bacterium]
MSADTTSNWGPATREQFRREVRRATRSTGIGAGALCAVGFPVWIAFDYLVEPERAGEFLWLRICFLIPILGMWLALIFSRFGERHPEVLLLGITLTINLAIGLMLAHVDDHYAAYALGMSLTFYGGAFALLWSPRWMAALIGLTLGGMAVILLVSDPIPKAAVATIFFYLGTAGALALIGQYYRQAEAWREFKGLVALEREQRRSSELVAELDRISRQDPLTGLANRRAWDEALEREMALAERRDESFSILLVDLDQLKEINDRLGHPVGDTVLRSVARLLVENSRESDVIARIGGDEFALLAPDCNLLDATELAEKLRRLVEEESTAAAGIGGVTISVGVADWERGDDAPEAIMLRGDRRLYMAKTTRNVVCAGDGPGRDLAPRD